MIKYIHGSADSLDVDVCYVFDKIPDYKECRRFCSEDKDENRNIIVIRNGIVTDCFIGTCDEINNGLIDTYSLHEQIYSLLITERVERDILLKGIRATRGVLSILSRTIYRTEVKKALRGNYTDRLKCLELIDFNTIDFDNLHKQMNRKDMLKVIAFQFGQSIGLFEGNELYTKSDVSSVYKELEQFLYRRDNVNLNLLNMYSKILVGYLKRIEVIEEENNISNFIGLKRKFDMVYEKEIIDNV